MKKDDAPWKGYARILVTSTSIRALLATAVGLGIYVGTVFPPTQRAINRYIPPRVIHSLDDPDLYKVIDGGTRLGRQDEAGIWHITYQLDYPEGTDLGKLADIQGVTSVTAPTEKYKQLFETARQLISEEHGFAVEFERFDPQNPLHKTPDICGIIADCSKHEWFDKDGKLRIGAGGLAAGGELLILTPQTINLHVLLHELFHLMGAKHTHDRWNDSNCHAPILADQLDGRNVSRESYNDSIRTIQTSGEGLAPVDQLWLANVYGLKPGRNLDKLEVYHYDHLHPVPYHAALNAEGKYYLSRDLSGWTVVDALTIPPQTKVEADGTIHLTPPYNTPGDLPKNVTGLALTSKNPNAELDIHMLRGAIVTTSNTPTVEGKTIYFGTPHQDNCYFNPDTVRDVTVTTNGKLLVMGNNLDNRITANVRGREEASISTHGGNDHIQVIADCPTVINGGAGNDIIRARATKKGRIRLSYNGDDGTDIIEDFDPKTTRLYFGHEIDLSTCRLKECPEGTMLSIADWKGRVSRVIFKGVERETIEKMQVAYPDPKSFEEFLTPELKEMMISEAGRSRLYRPTSNENDRVTKPEQSHREGKKWCREVTGERSRKQGAER